MSVLFFCYDLCILANRCFVAHSLPTPLPIHLSASLYQVMCEWQQDYTVPRFLTGNPYGPYTPEVVRSPPFCR